MKILIMKILINQQFIIAMNIYVIFFICNSIHNVHKHLWKSLDTLHKFNKQLH